MLPLRMASLYDAHARERRHYYFRDETQDFARPRTRLPRKATAPIMLDFRRMMRR